MRKWVFYAPVNHYGCIRAILQCGTWCFTPPSTITVVSGRYCNAELGVLRPRQPLRLYQGDIAMRNLVFYAHVNHYGCIRAILQCETWCFTPMSTITVVSGRYCNAKLGVLLPRQPLRLYQGDIAMCNFVFYVQSTITVISGRCPIQSSHIHASHKKDKLCYNAFAFVGGKKSLKYQCIKDPIDIRAAQSSGAV